VHPGIGRPHDECKARIGRAELRAGNERTSPVAPKNAVLDIVAIQVVAAYHVQ
jgi:hypothetical protein